MKSFCRVIREVAQKENNQRCLEKFSPINSEIRLSICYMLYKYAKCVIDTSLTQFVVVLGGVANKTQDAAGPSAIP